MTRINPGGVSSRRHSSRKHPNHMTARGWRRTLWQGKDPNPHHTENPQNARKPHVKTPTLRNSENGYLAEKSGGVRLAEPSSRIPGVTEGGC